MKVVAVSDLHGQLPDELPDGDVLVIAGDICPDFMSQRYYSQRGFVADKGEQQQAAWLREVFVPWLELTKPQYDIIFFIAGNHDYVFEHEFLLPEWPGSCFYLRDGAGYWNDGEKVYTFYGSPWVPNLPRWAFYATESALEARAASIPRNTDVLIVHGPPFKHRDYVGPSDKQQWKYANYTGIHVGDVPLNEALKDDLRPPVLICGHIHEQSGWEWHENGHTQVHNVAQLNDQYEYVYAPAIINV